MNPNPIVLAAVFRRAVFAVFAVPAACAMAALLAGCGASSQPQGAAAPPPISVATVVERDITEWDEYTGRLQAVNTVEVRPQVSGVLQLVAFTEGKEVSKGELLFQIDPRPFRAELDRAEAEAEKARTAATLAAAELARGQKLLGTRAISQEEYDQRAAASSSAAANVRVADAAARIAQLNLAYTRITAPIDGRIGRAEVTVGNLVVGGAGAAATLLATIVSMQPMYAYFEASEQDYLKYMDMAREGSRPLSRDVKNPVRMAVGNETDFRHEGYMDFVDNRVQPGTGTLLGRAVFPNPDRHLTPGMFVRVRLIGGKPYKGLLINDRAIATDQDRRFVLAVGANNVLEYRAIRTGPVVDGLRVVREGLKAGDRIVVNGMQRVRAGMPVTPQMVPMDETVAPEGAAPAATPAAK